MHIREPYLKIDYEIFVKITVSSTFTNFLKSNMGGVYILQG